MGASIDAVDLDGDTIRHFADKVPCHSTQILEQQYQKHANLRQLEDVQQRISEQSAGDAAFAGKNQARHVSGCLQHCHERTSVRGYAFLCANAGVYRVDRQ
jgi:hypothetical protein